MNKYSVTYYYLATGMEGFADTRDYGIVEANTPEEAVDKVIPKDKDPETKEFIKGCLTARELK